MRSGAARPLPPEALFLISETRIAIILPPREKFSPEAAGAIALVARRLAVAAGSVVLGTACGAAFADARFRAVRGWGGTIAALWRLRPQVVEVHRQPRLALLLSVLPPGARVLLFVHNDPLAMRGLRSAFMRRLMLRRLHRVVCVSDFLRQRYMAGLGEMPGPAVLPNPLSLDELPAPAAARAQNILFAGRIVPDKAPDVFIGACQTALAALPGWTATMLGGDRFGPGSPETAYVARLRAAAAAGGIRFTGPAPHGEVMRAMAAAAIVVVPSRWPEPFGLAALEAMASGAALITTGTGGLREVAGEAAVYVPPDAPEELAAAITALAADPAKRAALAAAGRARAAAFDTPAIAARLEELRRAPALF